jgi:adenylate cyclase class IV
VLNFDTEYDWKTIYKNKNIIVNFAEKQAQKIGAFLLIINGICRQTNEKSAKKYANEIMKSMGFSNIDSGMSPYRGTGYKWKMLHVRGLIM